MTLARSLPCPRCRRVLGPESWNDERGGACFRCKADFEFTAFPALDAGRVKLTPQAAVPAEDSVCFFHAENRAEAVCDGCGRLLCPVCAVPFSGRRLCPACIAANRTAGAPAVIRDRVLFDGIALATAGLPMLLWPFTALTAPLALGLVIYGWKKPCSLVRGRSRVRLILAGVIALLQIGAWVTVLAVWWSRR